ncbi:MAG: vitamin K epoxide reductase family protein [Candidatus Vogelbacteria bacterium]
MILNAPLHLLIIFVAFGGFLVAFYIRHKKRNNEVLVCPLESNCEAVVHSRYSKLASIPLELIGMVYYALVAVGHALFLIFPFFNQGEAVFMVMLMTVIAILFSLYLTFIQAAKLKEWCTWCLVSALFCAIIFLASLALV